jgi:hypothetical protein
MLKNQKPKKRPHPMEYYEEKYGLDQKTLRKYEATGMSLDDEESIKAYKAINSMDIFDDSGDDIPELKRRQLIAQTIKTEKEAVKVEIQLQKEMRKLIDLKELEETLLFLGNKLKGMLNRLEAELPPVLDGLPAEKMAKVIKEKLDAIYEYFEKEVKKLE